MNTELKKLAEDVRQSVPMSPNQENIVKAAMELAYWVGRRDGYEEASNVWTQKAA